MTTLPSTEGVSGPWVLCRVADNLVGIEASAVRSMVQLPEVTNVPHTPEHVRGVMNLRGRVLRVVDLRTQLGFASLTEETAKFLEALEHHEEDHKRWLDKLQEGAAVGEVHVDSDPAMCAFGRWFSSFKSDDIVLKSLFKRFELPHQRLHATADEVRELLEKGDRSAAIARTNQAHANELHQLTRLFQETRSMYRRAQREIALVLSDGDLHSAVVVDQVVSVELLTAVDEEVERNALRGVDRVDLLSRIAKRERAEGLVFLVSAHPLLAA